MAELTETAAKPTRAYVIHPDLGRARTQRREPEHALAEAVSLALALPGIEMVGSEVADGQEPVIGDDDQGIDLLPQFLNAFLGLTPAAGALEAEGPGDHGHGERAGKVANEDEAPVAQHAADRHARAPVDERERR